MEKLAQAAAELDLSGGPLHDHLLAAMRRLGPVTEHDLPVNLQPAYRAIRQAGRRVESPHLGSLLASLAAMSPEELDDLVSQIAMLAYLWLVDGRMVNVELVREGYAAVLTVPPNVRYERLLRACQREAREAGRGMWGRR